MTYQSVVGMTINEVAAATGRKRHQVADYLRNQGFTTDRHNHRIKRAKSIAEQEDEIAQRIAAAPPSQPCWRCGCRSCEHQDGDNTFQAFGDVAKRVLSTVSVEGDA